MARPSKRLTARGVSAPLPPGMHADGDGLYLVVDRARNKRWTFIYQWDGKRRELGLGALSKVGLADARELAAEQRRHVALGQDPKLVRTAASDGGSHGRYVLLTPLSFVPQGGVKQRD